MTSPYPLIPSPYPHLAFPLPSPNPLQASSPFPFPGLTPNYQPQPTYLSPNPLPAASTTSRVDNETEFDDVLRGLSEVEILLGRGEGVLREIKIRQGRVFTTGVEEKDLGSKSLEDLHVEYAQILQTLISTSTSSLTAALPVPLSAALPKGTTDGVSQPTLQDLTQWVQDRAGLEFSRREGVRSAARGIGEILKLGGGR